MNLRTQLLTVALVAAAAPFIAGLVFERASEDVSAALATDRAAGAILRETAALAAVIHTLRDGNRARVERQLEVQGAALGVALERARFDQSSAGAALARLRQHHTRVATALARLVRTWKRSPGASRGSDAGMLSALLDGRVRVETELLSLEAFRLAQTSRDAVAATHQRSVIVVGRTILALALASVVLVIIVGIDVVRRLDRRPEGAAGTFGPDGGGAGKPDGAPRRGGLERRASAEGADQSQRTTSGALPT